MKSLIVYHLRDYLRSYNYIPPICVYIITLVANYTYRPNPMLSSYGVTAIYLYFIVAWITISFFHTEDPVQQKLTILHAKSKTKYFMSKYFTAFLMVFVLSLVSVCYPIVANMFGSPITAWKLMIGILTHVLLGILAVSISVLFTRNLVEKSSTSWLGVMFALVVTIASVGVKEVLPGIWKNIILILPPVPELSGLMGESVPSFEIFFVYIWLCVYTFVLIILFLFMKNRRDDHA